MATRKKLSLYALFGTAAGDADMNIHLVDMNDELSGAALAASSQSRHWTDKTVKNNSAQNTAKSSAGGRARENSDALLYQFF